MEENGSGDTVIDNTHHQTPEPRVAIDASHPGKEPRTSGKPNGHIILNVRLPPSYLVSMKYWLQVKCDLPKKT